MNAHRLESTGIPLYPTHILFTNYQDTFGMELIGVSRNPVVLKQKIAKYDDVQDYFNPLGVPGDRPLLIIGEHDNFDPLATTRLSNLLLSQEGELSAATERFPVLSSYKDRLKQSGGEGAIFKIGPNFSCLSVSNCALVNYHDSIYRSRNILFLGLVSKRLSKRELEKFLLREMYPYGEASISGPLLGVATAQEKAIPVIEASALQNLYLSSGVLETTIDSFFEEHPQILQTAFDSKKIIYNSDLTWIQHDGSIDSRSIRPDAFAMRDDGLFDIVDFKLAKLNVKNLTKGKNSRRRFVDYINEGLVQLENYEFYFDFESNRKLAKQKYGIEVKNPRKTLIVGSMENVVPEQVTAARRPYKKELQIIDYDMLVTVYLAKVGSAD